MRKILLGLLVVLGLARLGGAADDKTELESIFNGKDLTGWKVPADNKWWKVVDGVLVGENDEAQKGSMLYTEAAYKDLIVEADVRFSGEIDSGIMIRKPELQLQIGTSRSLKVDMTCSFYFKGGYPEPARADKEKIAKLLKEGDWNRIRLMAVGPKFTVWLNGEQVAQFEDPGFPNAAPIGLQIHPKLKMKVEFKNIKVKAL